MEEQVKLLKEIRKELLKKHRDLYLCNIYAKVKGMEVHGKNWNKRYQLFQEEVSLFTPENALPFNRWEDVGPGDSWWEGRNKFDRIAFVDWMIEQYSQSK